MFCYFPPMGWILGIIVTFHRFFKIKYRKSRTKKRQKHRVSAHQVLYSHKIVHCILENCILNEFHGKYFQQTIPSFHIECEKKVSTLKKQHRYHWKWKVSLKLNSNTFISAKWRSKKWSDFESIFVGLFISSEIKFFYRMKNCNKSRFFRQTIRCQDTSSQN